MALKTRSKFYYGLELTAPNIWLDFDEGGGEISIELTAKSYAPSDITSYLASSMNDAPGAGFTYSWSFNRSTRKLTVTGSSAFDLLISTGTHATTAAWASLGFTGGVDLTGATSYTAADPVGLELLPQFYLLDYVSPDERQEAVEATINETGSGIVEIVKFGNRKFVEFNMEYINNYCTDGLIIEISATAYEDTINFLQSITNKELIEFMPDRDDTSVFYKLQLDKTEESGQGIGYKLKQMPDLDGYYRTGKLTFRVVE